MLSRKENLGLGIAPIVGMVAMPLVASVTEPLTKAATAAISSKVEQSVSKLTGQVSRSRGNRLAAQAAVTDAMAGAIKIKEDTAKFRGQKLGQEEYEGLKRQIFNFWNAFIGAVKQYKAAAGIAGLGRSEAEKRAARAAGVALAIRNTRARLNEALANISGGRPLVQIPGTEEEVDVPPPAPSVPAPPAPVTEKVEKKEEKPAISAAALLPIAALLLLR